MSAIAESLRRQRLPLLTIATVLVLGAVAWVLISQTTSKHLTTPDYPIAAPAVEQADWKLEHSLEGRFGKLTKPQQARLEAQRPKVAALVQNIYDAIFLEPVGLNLLVKESFSTEAARSISTDKLGFPKGATDVKTTKRRAHIALDAQTADFAIGRISIVAEAEVGGKQVDIEHRSTLWLERREDGWKVIAFDLEQGPAK